MSEPTLAALRGRIAALAVQDGAYVVHCATTGERPPPVAGRRFERRDDAATALEYARRYRLALREHDPRAPVYDLVVSEAPVSSHGAMPAADRTDVQSAAQRPGVPSATRRNDVPSAPATDARGAPDPDSASELPSPERRSRRGQFCHDVADALFETLAATGHEDVRTAAMDAYREVASAVADPDELCLLLLDVMARALDDRLDARGQLAVLRDAARRLPAAHPADPYPLVGAFERLSTVGLLSEFTVSPWFVDEAAGTRSCTASVRGYAFRPDGDGRVPTLPLTVDVLRRLPDADVALAPARRLDDGRWEFTVTCKPAAEPDGLARVPIDE